jgi:hypothetical protein
MKNLHLVSANTTEAELNRILAVQAANSNVLASYVPKTYQGKIVLFRAGTPDASEPNVTATAEDELALGWQQYSASPVELYESSGTHEQMIFEPHVSTLAMLLKPLLSEQ